jgi:hypothetical protein
VITGTMASEEASNSIRTLVLDVNNNDFNYIDHKSVEWLVVDDVLYTNDPSKVSNATQELQVGDWLSQPAIHHLVDISKDRVVLKNESADATIAISLESLTANDLRVTGQPRRKKLLTFLDKLADSPKDLVFEELNVNKSFSPSNDAHAIDYEKFVRNF